ncbi:exonuclease domain-containing protein [Paracoccaceae bacterium GXU_MW_L88]
MAAPIPPSRLILRLAAGLVGIGLGALALGLWLGAREAGSWQPFIIPGFIAGLGIIGAAVWLALRVQALIVRPADAFVNEIKLHTHHDPGHDFAAEIPALGRIGPATAEMARALQVARHEFEEEHEARSADLRAENAHLAAVIRDLGDAVIMCDAEDRLLMMNRAAQGMFEDAKLDRKLERWLDVAPIRKEVERQVLADDPSHELPPLDITVTRHTDGAQFHARVGIVDFAEAVAHLRYFISFRAVEKTAERPLAPRDHRPEFYDLTPRDFSRPPEFLEIATSRFVVFDTETTGLEPSNGDKIVQIAALGVRGGRIDEGDSFEMLVNPGRRIPQRATDVHGITDDMVAVAPGQDQMIARFADFTEGGLLVAHNAPFDMAFLRQSSEGAHLFSWPAICTVLLSAVLFPGETDHTLDRLAARFGVTIPKDLRHTAMGDARATAEVFVKMIPLAKAAGMHTVGEIVDATLRIREIRAQQARY